MKFGCLGLLDSEIIDYFEESYENKTIEIHYLDGWVEKREFNDAREVREEVLKLYEEQLKQAKIRDTYAYNEKNLGELSKKAKGTGFLTGLFGAAFLYTFSEMFTQNEDMLPLSVVSACSGGVAAYLAYVLYQNKKEVKEIKKYHKYLELLSTGKITLAGNGIKDRSIFDGTYFESSDLNPNSLYECSLKELEEIYERATKEKMPFVRTNKNGK